MLSTLENLFGVKKPIIGMIHLGGSSPAERIKRGLQELGIYNQYGVNGAIIEDYFGSEKDVHKTLRQYQRLNLKIILGTNLLQNPYESFMLASEFGARFVQFDSVQTRDLNLKLYKSLRSNFPQILVFGGIGFKYTRPTNNPLEQDLAEGKSNCEAIVTTGKETGQETPIGKLMRFKSYLGDFPLISGAGVTSENVSTQLAVADSTIVGTYFKKDGRIDAGVDPSRVQRFMEVVAEIRKST